MSKLILLILLLAFARASKAQTRTIDQKDIDIINYAVKDKRYNIMLVSEMHEYNLNEIKKLLENGMFVKRMVDDKDNDISDTIKLTNQDKDSILYNLNTLKEFKWKSSDAEKLNLNNVEVIRIDSSRNEELKYSIKYHIVPPIYFHNGTYCLLNFSYSCGGLCGHGQITIYKKTIEGWKKWNRLTWWAQ